MLLNFLPGILNQFRLENLGPILRISDSTNIKIKKIGLVRQITVRTFQSTSQDNLSSSTFLVTVSQTTDTRGTTRSKVKNVCQILCGDSIFPVNGVFANE